MAKENTYPQVKDVRLLKLARNAYAYPMDIAPDSFSGKRSESSVQERQFLLFDYFDLLTYVRSENITATDCFGLTGRFQSTDIPATSAHLITLSRDVVVRSPQADPFEYREKDKNYVKPFLSVIFVSMDLSATEWVLGEDLRPPVKQEQIALLLKHCSTELAVTAKETLSSDALSCVFQSINAGDFCVVIRSNNLNDTSILSNAITLLGTHRKDRHILGQLQYRTNIFCGVEYSPDKKLQLQCNERDMNVKVSLQIATARDVYAKVGSILKSLPEKLNLHSSSIDSCISISVSMMEFGELFPFLCEFKFGSKINSEFRQKHPITFPIVLHIVEWLERGIILSIDSHLHFNDNWAMQSDNNTLISQQERNQDIQQLSNYLTELRDLCYELRLPENTPGFYRIPYRNLLRQLDDLRKTFSYLWYQNESRINGVVFYVQFRLALNAIKAFLNYLRDMREDAFKKDANMAAQMEIELLNGLIGHITIFISAANSFNKLTQSVNFSSIQSPNYEMQTRVDSEKYLVAYTEFLRSVLVSFHNNGCKYGTDMRKRTFPIFYVDFSKQKITANTLFDALNPSYAQFPQDHVRMVAFGMPSVEMLAHIYDTLPLLMHEVSHMFRFLDRSERNHMLANLIIQRLSSQFMQHWISILTLGKVDFYDLGWLRIMLESIFVYCMHKYISEDIFSESFEIFSQRFEQLILLIFGDDDKPGNQNDPAELLDCFEALYGLGYMKCQENKKLGSDVDAEQMNLFLEQLADLVKEMSNTPTQEALKRTKEDWTHLRTWLQSYAIKQCFAQLEKALVALYTPICLQNQFISIYAMKEENHPLVNLVVKISELFDSKMGVLSLDGEFSSLREFSLNALNDLIIDLQQTEKQLAINALNSFWVDIERIWFLSKKAHRFIEANVPLEPKQNNLDVILLELQKKLKEEVQSILSKNGHMLHYRLISAEGQKVLNAFGILSSYATFKERFMSACAHFSTQQVRLLLNEAVQNYREIEADLGAVTLLRMNAFGYLNFIAKANDCTVDTARLDLDIELGKKPLLDRVRIVLALLLDRASETLEVKENVVQMCSIPASTISHSYYVLSLDSIRKSVINYINDSPERQTLWFVREMANCGMIGDPYTQLNDLIGNQKTGHVKKIADKMCKYLADREFSNGTIVESFNSLTESLQKDYANWHDLLTDDQRKKDRSYLPWLHLVTGLQRLYNMMIMLRSIQNDGKLLVDMYLFDIFKNCMNRFCNENKKGDTRRDVFNGYKWYQDHECQPWSDSVRNYLELTDSQRRAQVSHSEMFRDTLSFVIYYYYRNRLSFSTSLPNGPELKQYLIDFAGDEGRACK